MLVSEEAGLDNFHVGHPGTTITAASHRDARFVKTLHHRVAKIGDVPNFPLLWELANLAHAHAGVTPEQGQ